MSGASNFYLNKIDGIRAYKNKNASIRVYLNYFVVLSLEVVATMPFYGPNDLPPWPTDIRTVFFDDEDLVSPYMLRRATEDGRIRRLAPKLYTADLKSNPEDIVTENRWFILGRPHTRSHDRGSFCSRRWPNSRWLPLCCHRQEANSYPLTRSAGAGTSRRTYLWPGRRPFVGCRLTDFQRGPDSVDNMVVSRGRGKRPPRTLLPSELEDWLARKSLVWGQKRTERLHAEAVDVAMALDAEDRIEDINRLFGQLAGREPPRPAAGRYFQAAAKGRAWDERRVEMFDRIADGLAEYDDPDLPEWLPAEEVPGELPFFESYFSNYIEGTIFTVNEARHIVETQQPPAARPADGHDILGTYRCVVDPIGRKTVSERPAEIIAHLRNRHETIMAAGRPECPPRRLEAGEQSGGWVPVCSSQIGGRDSQQGF